jgi:hypothetical protein
MKVWDTRKNRKISGAGQAEELEYVLIMLEDRLHLQGFFSSLNEYADIERNGGKFMKCFIGGVEGYDGHDGGYKYGS